MSSWNQQFQCKPSTPFPFHHWREISLFTIIPISTTKQQIQQKAITLNGKPLANTAYICSVPSLSSDTQPESFVLWVNELPDTHCTEGILCLKLMLRINLRIVGKCATKLISDICHRMGGGIATMSRIYPLLCYLFLGVVLSHYLLKAKVAIY